MLIFFAFFFSLICPDEVTACSLYGHITQNVKQSDAIVVGAVCTPTKFFATPNEILSQSDLKKALDDSKCDFNAKLICDKIKNVFSSSYVLIDCTWDSSVANSYQTFAQEGYKILSGNAFVGVVRGIDKSSIDCDILKVKLSGFGYPLFSVLKGGRFVFKFVFYSIIQIFD